MAEEAEHPEIAPGYLRVTAAARGLLLDAGVRGSFLTIAYTAGCGGSGYRLVLATEPAAGLRVWSDGEVTLYLDGMAAERLPGAVVELTEDGEGVTLQHPEAVEAVWCG